MSIATGAAVEEALFDNEGEEPKRTKRKAKRSLKGEGTAARSKRTARNELFLIMARIILVLRQSRLHRRAKPTWEFGVCRRIPRK
jgi:hypothetical protein